MPNFKEPFDFDDKKVSKLCKLDVLFTSDYLPNGKLKEITFDLFIKNLCNFDANQHCSFLNKSDVNKQIRLGRLVNDVYYCFNPFIINEYSLAYIFLTKKNRITIRLD